VNGTAAIVVEVLIRFEALAALAIPTLVIALIDMAVVRK